MNNLIIVFACFSVFNIIASYKHIRALEITSKLFLMPTLFLSFPFVLDSPLLITVCILYTIGDALLLSSKIVPFVIGATAFASGHVAYYIYLARIINLAYLPFGLLALLLFIAYYAKEIFVKHELLNFAELAYIVFISTLMCLAFSSGSSIMAFGGFLFAFSDMLIVKARNGVMKSKDWLVMFTYILANFLLLYGINLIR